MEISHEGLEVLTIMQIQSAAQHRGPEKAGGAKFAPPGSTQTYRQFDET